MASAPTVRCDFIFWDWKQQPDFKAVEACINWLLSKGASGIYLTMAETTDDSYCVVISDSDLSADEATRAYEDWDGGRVSNGQEPADPQPYVWHRH